MFNTATSFTQILYDNEFGKIQKEELVQVQWQRGYFFFKQRLNYRAAMKVFRKYSLPTE